MQNQTNLGRDVVLSFGEALACATKQAMEQDARVFCYGEGINDPGGFFGSTAGLKEAFSEARCFDEPKKPPGSLIPSP